MLALSKVLCHLDQVGLYSISSKYSGELKLMVCFREYLIQNEPSALHHLIKPNHCCVDPIVHSHYGSIL